jgi:hypothetical protein
MVDGNTVKAMTAGGSVGAGVTTTTTELGPALPPAPLHVSV